MGLKLKVSGVAVYTNLGVKLKSRTTKEEANKEVERMLDKKKYLKATSGKSKNAKKVALKISMRNYVMTSWNESSRKKRRKIFSGMDSKPITN